MARAFFVFESGSLYVDLATLKFGINQSGLELTEIFSNAGLKGVCPHVWLWPCF